MTKPRRRLTQQGYVAISSRQEVPQKVPDVTEGKPEHDKTAGQFHDQKSFT